MVAFTDNWEEPTWTCSVVNTPSPLFHPACSPDHTNMAPFDLGESLYTNIQTKRTDDNESDSSLLDDIINQGVCNAPSGPAFMIDPNSGIFYGGWMASTGECLPFEYDSAEACKASSKQLTAQGEARRRHSRSKDKPKTGRQSSRTGAKEKAPIAEKEQILEGTTLMLRNIPNRFSRDMLLSHLNKHYEGEFDFVYLPIDFKNKCNIGYCFINFKSLDVCERFKKQFHGIKVCRCLPGGHMSKKVAEVTSARVHGLEENVKRLRNSAVVKDLLAHPEYMPIVFDENGCQHLVSLLPA